MMAGFLLQHTKGCTRLWVSLLRDSARISKADSLPIEDDGGPMDQELAPEQLDAVTRASVEGLCEINYALTGDPHLQESNHPA